MSRCNGELARQADDPVPLDRHGKSFHPTHGSGAFVICQTLEARAGTDTSLRRYKSSNHNMLDMSVPIRSQTPRPPVQLPQDLFGSLSDKPSVPWHALADHTLNSRHVSVDTLRRDRDDRRPYTLTGSATRVRLLALCNKLFSSKLISSAVSATRLSASMASLPDALCETTTPN